MSKKHFSAKYDLEGEKLGVGVIVLIWEEDGVHFAMSPSLDITGYGKTEAEAKASFEVMLQEFVTYTHRKKTIFQELERLGWAVNRKRKRVVAPDMLDMIKENDELKDVINKDYRKYERTVELAL
ncbi:MAG: hypothetical protein J5I62_13015 [Flavobacteriales bacterium]|nr:hypothetical protein [Flavobacteriales bacterium]MEB2340639.1 hypothetical protein [Flavobacteriia bacterium]